MEPEEKPSDRLYWGISALPGWNDALREAHSFGGPYQFRTGRVLSSILLAGGEDREPVATAGTLDDDGNGHVVVLYPDSVVLGVAEKFSGQTGDVLVSLHSLDEIGAVEISTRHSYYDGVAEQNRHAGLEIKFELAGREIVVSAARFGESPLAGDDAALAALNVLRDRKSRVV